MLKSRKVAVTGSLSAGKTTVCRLFETLGAYVLSADEIVHRLLSPGEPLEQQVIHLLGQEVVTISENKPMLDRKKVADLVFSNSEQLTALEALLHPFVFNEIDTAYKQMSESNQYPLFLAEIPLLYETKQEDRFDAVITVASDENLCRKRFSQKHPLEEFDKRMNKQLPSAIKAKKSDYVIYNNGTLEALKAQVATLYSQLIQAPPTLSREDGVLL